MLNKNALFLSFGWVYPDLGGDDRGRKIDPNTTLDKRIYLC